MESHVACARSHVDRAPDPILNRTRYLPGGAPIPQNAAFSGVCLEAICPAYTLPAAPDAGAHDAAVVQPPPQGLGRERTPRRDKSWAFVVRVSCLPPPSAPPCSGRPAREPPPPAPNPRA